MASNYRIESPKTSTRQKGIISAQIPNMKKVFPLSSPNHQPPRVVEQIKNDIRKYIKRERKKTLPDGLDFWDFDCKVGLNDATSETKHVNELNPAIDEIVTNQAASIYIEIIAIARHRQSKSIT